jgi:hypothetical protein
MMLRVLGGSSKICWIIYCHCEINTMGLDAWVYCNCIKKGKAPPHPFPELLAFDEQGEAILKRQGKIGLELWLTHDKWYHNSCCHSGHLIEKRIGNIALAGHVRGFLEDNSPNEFPLLLERVVYSGTHTGDWIAARDVPQLMRETRKLRSLTSDLVIVGFTNDMMELAEASIATGNPIVF